MGTNQTMPVGLYHTANNHLLRIPDQITECEDAVGPQWANCELVNITGYKHCMKVFPWYLQNMCNADLAHGSVLMDWEQKEEGDKRQAKWGLGQALWNTVSAVVNTVVYYVAYVCMRASLGSLLGICLWPVLLALTSICEWTCVLCVPMDNDALQRIAARAEQIEEEAVRGLYKKSPDRDTGIWKEWIRFVVDFALDL